MLGATLGDPEADGDGLPAADGLAEGLGVAGAGDGDADGAVAVPVVQALRINRQAERMNTQVRYRFMKNPFHSPAQVCTDPAEAGDPCTGVTMERDSGCFPAMFLLELHIVRRLGIITHDNYHVVLPGERRVSLLNVRSRNAEEFADSLGGGVAGGVVDDE